MNKGFIGLIIVTALFACRQETQEPTPTYNIHDYYPMKIGAEYIYLVDSINHNDFTETTDTFQFQLKEVYTDTFSDINGEIAYRIERFKRFKNDSIAYENLPWEISDVWWVTPKQNSIERVEENIRYINLSQPISNTREWNGNAYNQRGFWEFEYDSINQNFKGFPNTVKVVQNDLNDQIIFIEEYAEYYAKDIGLVGKTIRDIEGQNTGLNIPLLQRIEKGFQYRQVLLEYQLP